jgi:hypothetical protein
MAGALREARCRNEMGEGFDGVKLSRGMGSSAELDELQMWVAIPLETPPRPSQRIRRAKA